MIFKKNKKLNLQSIDKHKNVCFEIFSLKNAQKCSQDEKEKTLLN